MKMFKLKNISGWMAFAAALIFSFAACSDDKDADGGNVTFPAPQEATCHINEEVTISFSADTNWKLISNSGWCKFANGDFMETIISGTAGEQSVKAVISDAGHSYDTDDVAEIKLWMAGQEQVIYTLTRPKKKSNGLLMVKDAEGNVLDAETPIVVKGAYLDVTKRGLTFLTVESDFAVGLPEAKNPEWLGVSKDPKQGDIWQLYLDASKMDPIYSFGTEKNFKATFVVRSNEGDQEFSFPVVYEGLAEEEIRLEPAYLRTLNVSEDGYKFTEVDNGMDGAVKEYDCQIQSTVTTRNNEFHILTFAQKRTTINMANYYVYNLDETPMWLTAQDFGNGIVMRASEMRDNEQRGAVVMVFSNAQWEKIKDNLQEELFTTEDIGIGVPVSYLNEKYSKNMLANFIQEKEQAPAAELSFKGFYTNKAITNWSTASISDLTPFDGDDNAVYEFNVHEDPDFEPTSSNLWSTMFDSSLLSDGKSVCFEVVGTVPDGFMCGSMWNPWYETMNIEEVFIEGRRFVALTGQKNNEANVISIMVVNSDSWPMESPIELVIGMY